MSREWWQGNQGSTAGYGTFEARPAAPEPMLNALIDDETPVDVAPKQQQQQQTMASNAQINKRMSLERDLREAQLQSIEYPPGTPYGDKVQERIRRAQMELQFLSQDTQGYDWGKWF